VINIFNLPTSLKLTHLI